MSIKVHGACRLLTISPFFLRFSPLFMQDKAGKRSVTLYFERFLDLRLELQYENEHEELC